MSGDGDYLYSRWSFGLHDLLKAHMYLQDPTYLAQLADKFHLETAGWQNPMD